MLHTHERPDSLLLAAEHADDIPLLIAHLWRLGIPQALDAHIPRHAYWSNLSIGATAAIWLAHMLSQGDHKVRSIQSWVAARPETLRWCIGSEVTPVDVAEDRLYEVLAGLSHDEYWRAIELELNHRMLQNCKLAAERIRLTTHDGGSWHISPDGLFQVGQARSWRSGMVRAYVALATLDPHGVPLFVRGTASSGRSQVQLAELINYMRQALPAQRLCFVGDTCATVESRGAIHAHNNWYLCPLFDEPLPFHLLPGGDPGDEIEHLSPGAPAGSRQADPPAAGVEWHAPMQCELDGTLVEWHERRILVRSPGQARVSEEALRGRMARARLALIALGERRRGKRRPRTLAAMREAAEAIIDSYQVRGLLQLEFAEHVEERTVRRYRGRPTAVRVERDVRINVSASDDAWRQAVYRLGWQLFGTNVPAEALPLSQALSVAGEPERGFDRLNGRPLSLTPADLRQGDLAIGLVRLLSLGLRALSLLETIARRRLHEEGLLASQPSATGRLNSHTTSERLLDTFRDILLTCDDDRAPYNITPLSMLQQRVLSLVSLPATIYQFDT